MEHKIAFDPALGLTSADLAAAWNANPPTARRARKQRRPVSLWTLPRWA